MNNYILRIKRIASDYWDIADIEDKDIAINLGAAQIGDFGIATNDYTQRINLPFTYTNESIFAGITNNFTRSQAPYQNYECRLHYRNREIFGKGSYLTILKVSNKSIEICISSGVSDFFKKLRDIDFTAEEYRSLLGYTVRPLTLTAFRNEEYTPVPSGIIYPKTKVSRWGDNEQRLLDAKIEEIKSLNPTLNPQIEAMLRAGFAASRQSDFVSNGIIPNAYPCIMLGDPRENRNNRHAWGILTFILDHLGYTLESNISSFIYYCFAVPMRTANISLTDINYTSYPSQLQEAEEGYSRCYFLTGDNLGNGHPLCERHIIDDKPYDGYQIGIGGEGIYPKVSLFLKFPDADFATMPTNFETELIMYDGGVEDSHSDDPLSSVILLRSDFIVKAEHPDYHVCSVILHYNGRTEVNGVVINDVTNKPESGAYKDDYISVWQKTTMATNNIVGIPCFLSITHEVISSDYAVPGTQMYIAPNMVWNTAEDFFKTFIRLFGLMVEVDEVNKVVKLNTLSKVYQDKYFTAIDWSEKLDISQTIEENYSPDGTYAKKNKFRFTKNEKIDKIDEAYATIDNETLSQEKIMCGDELSAESADANSITWFRNTEGLATEWEDMTFPQFFHYSSVDAPFSNDFSHYIVQPVTASECLEMWYDYLFGVYANEFIFKDYLKITAYFNLNEEDIASFKQVVPVFIRKFGAFFYVNKIKNYMSGKTTQVELIRL